MSAKDKETPDQYASADPSSATTPAAVESSIVDAKDPKRRKLLVGGAAAVGGLGTLALVAPMLASMSPSARARAAGAPVEADVSKLAPGQLLTVEWRGKPVWIVHRTEDMLGTIDKDTGRLRDPASEESVQPEYAQNPARATKPEYLVVVGVCTHLGCSPTYRPEVAAPDLGSDWDGGFFCPCHGSKFDLSGRVYAGVPAPTNLEVPPYRYADDGTLVVGEDPEGGEAAA